MWGGLFRNLLIGVGIAEFVQDAVVFGGEIGGGEEVGAVLEGFLEGHAAAPAPYDVVVAAGERFWDGESAELGGTSVVGVVEESAGAVGGAGWRLVGSGGGGGFGGELGLAEAFEAGGVGVAEGSGEEADEGVDDDGGGELTAGENIVADGELAVAEGLVDALVDAFVASAEEDDAVEAGELVGDGLGEGLALGGEEDDGLAGEVAGGFGGEVEGVEGVEDGLGLEDHAFSTAEGAIVDGAVTVVGEGTEVVGGDVDLSGSDGAAEDSVLERGGEEVGKDGEDVNVHSEVIRP